MVRDIGQLELNLVEAMKQPESAALAEKLRSCWETLKSNGERLVRAMENGHVRQVIVCHFNLYFSCDAATPGGLMDLY